MDEQTAKSKWCPFVRFQIGPSNAAWQDTAYTNRGEELNPPKSVMCIASDCMMWRWRGDKPLFQFEKYRANKEATVEPVPRPLNIPASWEWIPYNPENDDYDAGWLEPTEEADKRRRGYCGLAGKVNA